MLHKNGHDILILKVFTLDMSYQNGIIRRHWLQMPNSAERYRILSADYAIIKCKLERCGICHISACRKFIIKSG